MVTSNILAEHGTVRQAKDRMIHEIFRYCRMISFTHHPYLTPAQTTESGEQSPVALVRKAFPNVKSQPKRHKKTVPRPSGHERCWPGSRSTFGRRSSTTRPPPPHPSTAANAGPRIPATLENWLTKAVGVALGLTTKICIAPRPIPLFEGICWIAPCQSCQCDEAAPTATAMPRIVRTTAHL